MKVFILMHKKHAHVVGVYASRETCEKAQAFLNSIFTKKTYCIVEKNVIWERV